MFYSLKLTSTDDGLIKITIFSVTRKSLFKITQAGSEIFCFSIIFSLKCSPLDHLATVPPLPRKLYWLVINKALNPIFYYNYIREAVD